jgi:hypothetical protein
LTDITWYQTGSMDVSDLSEKNSEKS